MDTIGISDVFVGAVAVVVTVMVYLRQRQHKSLGYAVLTNRPLLAFSSPFSVSVQHKGKEVAKPRLVIARVANTGNVPIRAADFERLLRIGFPAAEVLSVEVTAVWPGDLEPKLRVDKDSVIVEPCLLNPADVIELQCLLDGDLAVPEVDCRVVGVSAVRQVDLPRDSWGKVWRVSLTELVSSNLAALALLVPAIWFAIQDRGFYIVLGAVLVAIAALNGWSSVRKFRRTRLWLTIPPPAGH